MARKKQTAKEQAQGLGCLVLIGLAVVVYASSNRDGASSLTPSSASSNRTRTTSPAPSPTSSNYGQVIDVADEQVTMPSDVVFYQCQHLSCPEAGTIAEGHRILVTKMIGGDVVNGVELWVVAEDGEGDEAYAPMVYVFPPTPTETATP